MPNEHIRKITAVTEVFPDGQKCVGAVLEYSQTIETDAVKQENYRVEGRTVTGAWLCGEDLSRSEVPVNHVFLALSREDPSAKLFLGDAFFLHDLLEPQSKDVHTVHRLFVN